MTADTLSLAGKTAIITGSGRENGIGAGIARAFARNGADVAIHFVSPTSKERAEKVAADIAKEFGTKTAVVEGTIDDPSTAKSIIDQTLKGLGTDHVDILVNNAGYVSMQDLLQVTQEEVIKGFGVNVFGTIYLTQAVVGLGKMPPGGRIINIGSVTSRISTELMPLYAASKAAQDNLISSWASVLGHDYGITVNTLAPGPVFTDMSKPYLAEADGSATETRKNLSSTAKAADRLGTVEDLADAALLLASEKSRWITAQWISVSGGMAPSAVLR